MKALVTKPRQRDGDGRRFTLEMTSNSMRVRRCLINRLRVAEAIGLSREATRRTCRPRLKSTRARLSAVCPLCLLVGAAVCLHGCASGPSTVSSKRTAADKAFVRKVDYSQAPETKELAERARQIGDEMYPKILTLLADDGGNLPQQFDIVFKKHLSYDNHQGVKGVTKGSKIHLDSYFLANNPVYLDVVLVHEMAHVAQDYEWYRGFNRPSCWREGIADYVCYKLGYTNGPRCPECAFEHPHYTSGYTCAGAFLLYMDTACGSDVVRQLNRALRRGSYSDRLFVTATGKSLEELWAEFQKTPAFTPIATEINKLRDQLGYTNGRPPKNIRARFEAYLRQRHAASEISELRQSLGYVDGKPPRNVVDRYPVLQYFKQPAGVLTQEAAKFLGALGQKGELPGWSKDIWFDLIPDGWSVHFPVSRTFHGHKIGDQALYHYTIVRESQDRSWKMQRAWRTGPDGRVIEEYPVP